MTTHRWTCGGACAVLGVLLASLAGCSALARPTSAATEWTYVVAFRSGGEELQVELRVPGGEAFELSIPEASRPFLDEVRCTIDGNRFNLTSEEDGWSVPASAHVRSVQWTFRARDAARTIDALGLAAWRGGAFVGSPSAFLLVSPHPASNGGVNGPRMSLAVRESNGIGFACALDHQDDLWTGDLSVLQELPTCAFGALSVVRRTVDVPSGPPVELTVARARATNRMDEAHGTADADREALRDHRLVNALVADADGLARYIGRFPVDRLLVVALPRDGRGVGDGVTRGYGGASIVVSVDPDTSPEEFRDDWVLTHEMIHLALPSLPEEQHWLEEGSATYLEPLVRASAGTLDENAVWTSMLQEYDQGLPKVGDHGLNHDRDWGRTYYGGAIFCLLADVEIRVRTGGRRTLADAIGAVVRGGGNVTVESSIDRVIEVGDSGTGTHVLRELYERTKDAAEPRSLDETWRALGVTWDGERVVFDDRAPLAAVRRAMTAKRP